jgi:hypothetical protein
MARVACTVMLKDERAHVGPFLAYHSYLFGASNIFVVDNGSSDPEVLRQLAEFKERGGHVDNSHAGEASFLRKGEIIGDIVKSLEIAPSYDFYILLDCDEFVVLRNTGSRTYVCDKEPINAYFDQHLGETRVMMVTENLYNIIGKPNLYGSARYIKTIYPTGVFLSTDLGFHVPVNRNNTGHVDSDIVYVHMHFRPYEELVYFARQKLAAHMGLQPAELDDREKLIKHQKENGRGRHMINYLLDGSKSYYEQARRPRSSAIHFPQLNERLKEMGSALPYSDFIVS